MNWPSQPWPSPPRCQPTLAERVEDIEFQLWGDEPPDRVLILWARRSETLPAPVARPLCERPRGEL